MVFVKTDQDSIFLSQDLIFVIIFLGFKGNISQSRVCLSLVGWAGASHKPCCYGWVLFCWALIRIISEFLYIFRIGMGNFTWFSFLARKVDEPWWCFHREGSFLRLWVVVGIWCHCPRWGMTSSWWRARHGLDSLLFYLFVIVILFHYYFCFYWSGVVIGRVGCFIMCAISPA